MPEDRYRFSVLRDRSVGSGSLHLEVESIVTVETEVLGLLVLVMAKIAVGLGTVVPRFVWIQWLHIGGLFSKSIRIAMATQALFHGHSLGLLHVSVTTGTLDPAGGMQFSQPLVVGLVGTCGINSSREHKAKEQGD